MAIIELTMAEPAAFRRLCVETNSAVVTPIDLAPAAFRRLCVETVSAEYVCRVETPAAFRRLCVETAAAAASRAFLAASRL